MDLGHTETDRILNTIESKVAKVYRQANKETQAKLNDYLRKFKVKDKAKKLELIRGEITKAEYTRWRIGQIEIGKRWQEMVNTLAEDYTHANQISAGIINKELPRVYALNHNYTAYDLESKSGIDLSFSLYDRNTVERLIKDEPNLLPESRVDIPKDLRWNKQHIVNAVTQGILQGESISNLSKRLTRVVGMNKAVAVRNARTMVTSAENAGRINSYKHAQDMGVKLKQEWVSARDGRTRDSHRAIDGEKIKIGGVFSNGCRYPGDPHGPAWEVYNCRCTLVAAIDDIDTSDAFHNNKLGSMSYEEWKKGKK